MIRFLLFCATAGLLQADTPNIIVLFSDDQGWADLGSQGVVDDIKTPHLDRIAKEGVRFTDGYITAPQCSPSRAGLITGRYQQRFGFDTIPDCPLPLSEKTIGNHMQQAGYTTGMVGKWHLEPNVLSRKWAEKTIPEIAKKNPKRVPVPFKNIRPYLPDARGFSQCYHGEMQHYWATYGLDGEIFAKPKRIVDERLRIDIQSDAAVQFLENHHADPFFLFVSFYAPHTPLQATEKYLSRFPGEMPERRRYGLALMAAIDDGVGRILEQLDKHNIDKETLIFFLSDNGAPLKIHKVDSPVDSDPGGWDGSLNDPLVGEKGMLTEGGIRVPFLARWKGTLPAGKVYSQPVISLDIAATALELAGQEKPPHLDGKNLIPFLTGEKKGSPHQALYWRFWNQAAIREGNWKYLSAGKNGRFLFDLASEEGEGKDLHREHPEKAAALAAKLESWTNELRPKGIPKRPLNVQEIKWFAHYLKHEE